MLLRALALKRSRPSTIVECSVEGAALNDSTNSRSVDSAAKDQNVAGFGTNDEMLLVDRTFDPSGLIGTLEVPFDSGAFLLEIEVFRRRASVRVVAIERPFTGDVRRQPLRWSLLRPCGGLTENHQEPQTDKTIDMLFHS